MALFFKTWESMPPCPTPIVITQLICLLGMVLFHASFVALKARCPLTADVHADDFRLKGENRLFQA
jgi:hypothetical protein